jgi:putative membrane protein
MGSLLWLLQWPVRAAVLLLVAALPLGVEIEGYGVALLSAVVIGLLGTLLIWPIRVVLGPVWAVTSMGGLISPVTLLFNWLITVVLFALAAWLIEGFSLRRGLFSAVLGAVVYAVISTALLRLFGLEVPLTRVAALLGGWPVAFTLPIA